MPGLLNLMQNMVDARDDGQDELVLFTHHGTTVYADFVAGEKSHYDYLVSMRGGELLGLGHAFRWRDLVQAVHNMNHPRQTQLMVATVWGGESPLRMPLAADLALEDEVDWGTLARLVQATIVQEEFNYPNFNGWWWAFHVFSCIAQGANEAVVLQQAGYAPPHPEICDGCGQCNVRPWGNPLVPSRDLRDYYEDEDTPLLRADFRHRLLD